ncbi:hypothetical protein TNCV_3322271 [Trichonephila clavipes]|nr:hypothetical protein TNCV_3322271 [Trichonephila clavipes]
MLILLEPQLLDIMIVQFRNEKVSNHGSTFTITIDCNAVAYSSFLKKYGPMIPPAHKAHQILGVEAVLPLNLNLQGLGTGMAYGIGLEHGSMWRNEEYQPLKNFAEILKDWFEIYLTSRGHDSGNSFGIETSCSSSTPIGCSSLYVIPPNEWPVNSEKSAFEIHA